jgi:protein-S-isoprenylcysteine O-methyltransferase Ste14
MTLVEYAQYIGLGGFILWAIVERGFHLMDQEQAQGEKVSQWSFWLINLFWYGAMFLAIFDVWGLEWTLFKRPLLGLRLVGILLIILGIGIRILSRKALGKQFSVHVETSDEHTLITEGIYHRLRHPAYLGLLCLFLGIPLALGSWGGFAIAVIGGIPSIIFRIIVEERFLSEWFGADYRKYQADTWRLIPFIW